MHLTTGSFETRCLLLYLISKPTFDVLVSFFCILDHLEKQPPTLIRLGAGPRCLLLLGLGAVGLVKGGRDFGCQAGLMLLLLL